MPQSMHDDEAAALLRAAERSLFDATSRVEQAVAALAAHPDVDGAAVYRQAQLWSKLIQVGLEKLGRGMAARAA